MKDERETKEKLLQSTRAEFLAKGVPGCFPAQHLQSLRRDHRCAVFLF